MEIMCILLFLCQLLVFQKLASFNNHLCKLVIFCMFIKLITIVGANVHTNEFAVHIPNGGNSPDEVAAKYGFLNKGQIGNLKGYYLFEHHNIQKRSLEPSTFHSELLKNDPSVSWCEQQKIKRRVKRKILKNTFPNFHDPLYPEQWFLHGGGFGSNDMNVIPAWKEGYTGKGIVVSILDDGIQSNHPDLAQNYDKDASWDINDADDDPNPQDDDDNKHGTRCAGEVAAVANNEFCGVGIAYNSSIGGVRMLDGPVTDTIEATALSLNPNHIDIYSASWGPEDDGKTVDGPGKLAKIAFQDGIQKGRSGLGSIFVWASGNGGRYNDNCNCDGYTNSIYTISVSSATQSGMMPWYLEQCSSTLATTYSSGATNIDQNIVTVDVNYKYFTQLRNGFKPDPSDLCTRSHTGTSASAPIAAAICALALEANPQLTWRDMQYIIVLTSRYNPLSRESGWITNGIGRKVSTKFGYGLMDAVAMVKLAKRWKTLPPQHICATIPDTTERIISSAHGSITKATMVSTGCENSHTEVRFLEHVQVKISLNFVPRGNLHITLISPANTRSVILLPRPYDSIEGSFKDWPFMSVHFWGEAPQGTWTLIIANDGKLLSTEPGKLTNWSLIFYGTKEFPYDKSYFKEHEDFGESDKKHTFPVRGVNRFTEPYSYKCAMLNEFEVTIEGERTECRRKCPDGQYGNLKDFTCNLCDESCSSCYGPSYNNCLSCSRHLLFKGTCMNSCPDGYFSDTSQNQCIPCTSTCLTCQLSPVTCDACKPGLLFYDKKCLYTCPEGTYKDQDMCKKCHRNCASCNGPYSNNCLSCLPIYVFHNNSCLKECPDPFYPNDELICTRCHWSCDSCMDKSSCTRCRNLWDIDSSELCSYTDSNCRKGWYNPYASCQPCHSHCEQCSGPGIQDCVRCEKDYLWLEGECTSVCPEEYFSTQDECQRCSSPCVKCTDSTCLACAKGYLLHQGKCIQSCPYGDYDNGNGRCEACHQDCFSCSGNSNQNCTSCPQNFYLHENACLQKCPNGFFPVSYEDKNECSPCYPGCKSCSDYSPLHCTSCYENTTFSNGVCIPCLDGEFFNKEHKVCERCHQNCGRCYGPLDSNCLSCNAPLRLDEVKHKCLPCCRNRKKSGCCSCSANLDICINSDHPRSIILNFLSDDSDEVIIPLRHVVPIVIAICSTVVLLFIVLFGILQAHSMGWCTFKLRGQKYERVPNNSVARFETEMEKLSLTQGDLEEEDDVYEKV